MPSPDQICDVVDRGMTGCLGAVTSRQHKMTARNKVRISWWTIVVAFSDSVVGVVVFCYSWVRGL